MRVWQKINDWIDSIFVLFDLTFSNQQFLSPKMHSTCIMQSDLLHYICEKPKSNENCSFILIRTIFRDLFDWETKSWSLILWRIQLCLNSFSVTFIEFSFNDVFNPGPNIQFNFPHITSRSQYCFCFFHNRIFIDIHRLQHVWKIWAYSR